MKTVNDALSQRRLRPDNHQLNTFFMGKFNQFLYIARASIKVAGNLSRAGITRGGINLFNPGALGQLPDQGVLPGPTTNDQYLQFLSSSGIIQRPFRFYKGFLHRVIARPFRRKRFLHYVIARPFRFNKGFLLPCHCETIPQVFPPPCHCETIPQVFPPPCHCETPILSGRSNLCGAKQFIAHHISRASPCLQNQRDSSCPASSQL